MAKSYKTHVFSLRALTNLHAGAGDSFYGAVDKMVQRDAATERPVIHSHSLKGALREYFEEELGLNQDFVNRVFGTPVKGKAEDARPGAYRFFSADLMALPVPQKDMESPKSFELAADPVELKRYVARLKQMGCTQWADETAFKPVLQPTGMTIETSNDFPKRFRDAADELPVVARNCLNNGKSENLWYEELVPRESIFVFTVQSGPTKDKERDCTVADEKLFLESLALAGKTVQIGANASVGYGYCLLTLLNPAL